MVWNFRIQQGVCFFYTGALIQEATPNFAPHFLSSWNTYSPAHLYSCSRLIVRQSVWINVINTAAHSGSAAGRHVHVSDWSQAANSVCVCVYLSLASTDSPCSRIGTTVWSRYARVGSACRSTFCFDIFSALAFSFSTVLWGAAAKHAGSLRQASHQAQGCVCLCVFYLDVVCQAILCVWVFRNLQEDFKHFDQRNRSHVCVCVCYSQVCVPPWTAPPLCDLKHKEELLKTVRAAAAQRHHEHPNDSFISPACIWFIGGQIQLTRDWFNHFSSTQMVSPLCCQIDEPKVADFSIKFGTN